MFQAKRDVFVFTVATLTFQMRLAHTAWVSIVQVPEFSRCRYFCCLFRSCVCASVRIIRSICSHTQKWSSGDKTFYPDWERNKIKNVRDSDSLMRCFAIFFMGFDLNFTWWLIDTMNFKLINDNDWQNSWLTKLLFVNFNRKKESPAPVTT